MSMLYESPTVSSTTSGGLPKFWRIEAVAEPGNRAFTRTYSWRKLEDGSISKVMVSEPSYSEAKNVGRSNETSPGDQAVAEARSALQLKLDKGYKLPGDTTVSRPLPMLAQKFAERKHNLKYPCAVQPKLDGIRMLFDGKVGYSRQGNDFIPETIQHLRFDTGGLLLDGELMLPQDEYTFQQTTSAVKKIGPLSPKLEYHVYDIVDQNRTFRQRAAELQILSQIFPENVKLVETVEASKEDSIHNAQDHFTENGFEGTMVRNWNGKYKIKDRSNDLLKYKEFQDEEYRIIGFEEGVAKHTGCVIFVCETSEGKSFKVTPKATVHERKRMWNDRKNLTGKMITVQYQNLTEDGVPRFPIGKTVRDYE